ncbi:tRNA (adenosine(37)-N6)-threonylcarbamoyltransferase complex dimerization subunit type 1 TsaB [Nisaea sediminum]|uniref:tRNA (adenosine(37)-N6)-threonylcarbamoyltransferase complex dimerization subunit type 1 TsaB n=1 Tax=Nisaea sediminum TaxID=2775867 RepID=UPI0018693D8C|nr:tRNA (adenosine(37)-N6)-threonylcarbamoyltransferase complex dimerization subunit type 1 TsaB [Nisaea sediminum]
MAHQPRTILGIDSSTGACSVALRVGADVRAVRREDMTRGQSERLAPMTEEIMREAGLGFEALDAIAVSRGPGSFTGLRIGLAFAKGLGQALGIPVVGVTGFAAVARAARAACGDASNALAVVLESRRADLFLQIFKADGTPEGAPAALPADAIAERLARLAVSAPLLLAGDAADKVAALLGSACIRSPATVPDADDVSALGLALLEAGTESQAAPLYLRAPDVTHPASS